MPEFPTYEERQKYIKHELSFQHVLYDRVYVFRKATNYEGGWAARWVPPMDQCIGNYGTITKLGAKDGTGITINFENGDEWVFPYTCLRILR